VRLRLVCRGIWLSSRGILSCIRKINSQLVAEIQHDKTVVPRKLERVLRCFDRYSWSLWIFNHLRLWGLGRPIYTEGAGFRQSGSDGVQTWNILVTNFHGPLLWYNGGGHCLLVELCKLLSGQSITDGGD
jgi:CobQ-like glutamine amidotransferase family enzyme